MGASFLAGLRELQKRHPSMGDVRGLGMMIGVEFVRDRETKEPAVALGAAFVKRMLERGFFATNYGGTWHNVVKMAPPLVITPGQIEATLAAFDACLAESEAESKAL